MVTRSESAAATRRDLLAAARELLAEGGPQAVTLREVGARAQVSRGAPYRHFADKDSLLAAVGAESWDRITGELAALHPGPADRAEVLTAALRTLLTVGRREPEVYRVMFTMPSGDPEIAVRAAGHAQDEFLRIVGAVVGDRWAHLYGAMLLTSAHGITSMAASGHLSEEMWRTTTDQLIESLIDLVVDPRSVADARERD